MCCTSLRGAAYFGASIHITLGAVLFIRYVIVTAFLTFFNVTDVIKDRITGYLLPFMAYVTLFLAFGIVIFHSVEKEYFIILKWATLGFSLLQILVLVALYVLRFHPAYEYRQFPFLPVSITDGYVHAGFQTPEGGDHPSGGPTSPDHLSEDGGYSSEFLPKLTRSPGVGGDPYPTSATSGSSSSGSSSGRHYGSSALDKGGGSSNSAEISHGMGGGGESVLETDFIQPVPTAPPNKWLADVYSLIAIIVMTVVSLVYLVLLFIYVRQLIYEDSGHVFGHAQSVTRNVAFYVQPQFAQSGNSDNKLTNSPSPALRSKTVHSLQQASCTSHPLSNTQIPSEFLPQPHNQQQQRHQVGIGNHLKPGTNPEPNTIHHNQQQHKDVTQQQQHQQQPPTSQSQSQQQNQNPNHNHVPQRSPVPPAREMQQNIQNQQQQQVITIYPQKGGGYTSSSSSPRMQVKFAKPLEQHPQGSTPTQPHSHHSGELPEPPRSCLANSNPNPTGNNPQQQQQQCNNQQQAQPQQLPPAHMMPPPPPPRYDSRHHSHPPMSVGGPSPFPSPPPPMMHGHGQPQMGQIPPPVPHHQGQHQHGFGPPPPPPPHAHIHGGQLGPAPPYTHQQQHMPYHGKSRAQQQSYNDMVDNSSYLVFSQSGNPNTSNAPPMLQSPALHPSHLACSTSHTYPHCSQRRPSGSMV